MDRWGFQVVPHILDKKLGNKLGASITVMNVIVVSRSRDLAYRVEPGVRCNSTLCNCLSMREVTYSMLALPVALLPLVLTYLAVFHFDQ